MINQWNNQKRHVIKCRDRDEARHARADRLAMAPVELSESVNEQRQAAAAAAAAAATHSTTSQLYHQTSDNVQPATCRRPAPNVSSRKYGVPFHTAVHPHSSHTYFLSVIFLHSWLKTKLQRVKLFFKVWGGANLWQPSLAEHREKILGSP